MGCLKLKVESDSLMTINFIKRSLVVWDDVEAEVAKI